MVSRLRAHTIWKERKYACTASSDTAPTKLPAILGAIFLVGGVVVFAVNLRRPQDTPVHTGHKVWSDLKFFLKS